MAQPFLEQLKDSLEQNSKLNEPAKESIFLLVQRMSQKVNFPTDLLIERLKHVSLEVGTKFLDQEAYHCNISNGEIRFRPDKIDDQAHTLCQALLEMAIIKEPGKGMDDPQVVAIKKGALEIFANYAVNNNGERGIAEDEQVIVNLMDILTEGKILEGFVKDDSEMLQRVLQEKGLQVVNNYANYNAVFRQSKNPSQLGHIEKILINQFFGQSPEKIQQHMSNFETNLVSSPEVMADSKQYWDLNQVGSYYQQKKMLIQQATMEQPSLEISGKAMQ